MVFKLYFFWYGDVSDETGLEPRWSGAGHMLDAVDHMGPI